MVATKAVLPHFVMDGPLLYAVVDIDKAMNEASQELYRRPVKSGRGIIKRVLKYIT
jgi:hypothetical protein